ncbi:MAG TPA: hypothetical protein VMW35_00925 [Myxococcota bacterium]|nr:hypothetical protein [Myxococcota bacterium]
MHGPRARSTGSIAVAVAGVLLLAPPAPRAENSSAPSPAPVPPDAVLAVLPGSPAERLGVLGADVVERPADAPADAGRADTFASETLLAIRRGGPLRVSRREGDAWVARDLPAATRAAASGGPPPAPTDGARE